MDVRPEQTQPSEFEQPESARGSRRSVTPRALILGAILLPVNAYWVVCMEIIRYSAHPSTISLFFNCIFELILLTLVNHAVGRRWPKAALCQGELLLIYAMLAIGTAMCGHDMIQVLIPMIAWPVYGANSTNHISSIFAGTYPHWLTLTDYAAAKDFFRGDSTLYTTDHLKAWALPLAAWALFLLTLVFVMQCINVILRKQWTENERLGYPLIQLPLAITAQAPGGSGGVPLTRNPLFWIGFALAASIDIVNSISYYHPSVPPILAPGGKLSYFDIGQYVTQKPWSAIGSTDITFYPFMIGIGMLMPLDFLFSMWFFYIFWKMQSVATVAFGWDADPRMPYATYQALGAYFFFGISSIYLARVYLKDVFNHALGRPSAANDDDEPLRYRTALLGILVGMILLIGFSIGLGMSWWLAILFFLIYLAIALAITRMRAEMGVPIHEVYSSGPDALLSDSLGQQSLSHRDLGMMSLYFWFNRSYRCVPMPIQLEGFKMAEATGHRKELRGWFGALLFAAAFGIISAMWAMLHLTYQFGAFGHAFPGAMDAFSTQSWNRLHVWLTSPKPANSSVVGAVVFGLLFAAILQGMRMRFVWWPFHPLAFAITASPFEINLVWFPLFIAWLVKTIILRYGGGKLYHKSLPFFFGLILGQFIEGSLLNIWGISTGNSTYQVWQ